MINTTIGLAARNLECHSILHYPEITFLQPRVRPVGQRCACHDADYAGRWRPLSRIMATDSIHTVVCYCPVCGALAMQLLLIHLQYFERHIAICVWDLTYGSTCMAVVSRCITLCNGSSSWNILFVQSFWNRPG